MKYVIFKVLVILAVLSTMVSVVIFLGGESKRLRVRVTMKSGRKFDANQAYPQDKMIFIRENGKDYYLPQDSIAKIEGINGHKLKP